jgi:hypothetical protein
MMCDMELPLSFLLSYILHIHRLNLDTLLSIKGTCVYYHFLGP